MSTQPQASIRLDKWCWAARFFRTRTLAAEAIHRGRVSVNGAVAKPARDLQAGHVVTIRQEGGASMTVVVRSLAAVRGSATAAQALYEETPESRLAREHRAEQRRLAPEPAAALPQGRPTKRERRDLDRASGRWQRWSASIDDES